MGQGRWMLYGANGFTGKLIAEEATKRGHRPLLAGRAPAKVAPVAQRLGLDWVAVDLQDTAGLANAVAQADLVLHAAGPFVHTSAPMLRACITARKHYVDITGEIAVFQHTFSYDAAARQQGITLMSGAGFDVVPSDCLAKYVAAHVPAAIELHIAIAPNGRASAGTIKSAIEQLPRGGIVRCNGRLMSYPLGQGGKRIRFPTGEQTVLPIPWGDLETAYRSTGIPNITTYMAYPPQAVRLIRWIAPLSQRLLAVPAARRLFQRAVERSVRGPDAQMRQTGRAHLWACAVRPPKYAAQAWLETAEAYQFTARSSVRCVEAILEQQPCGALTPAQAFGADFVLDIAGTQRFDSA